MKTPKVEEDPELERQRVAARNDKLKSLQEKVGTDTAQSLRYFGARSALSGSSGMNLLKI